MKTNQEDEQKEKDKIKGVLLEDSVLLENNSDSRNLYNRNNYGINKDGQIYLSFYEAFYLFKKNKICIFYDMSKKNKKELVDYKKGLVLLDEKSILLMFNKKVKDFLFRFLVYSDLRERGYLVRTGFKFGSDFRVYDKGKKLGEDHSKWLVYCIKESDYIKASVFSGINRVANTTKKTLLLAVVDDEKEITYYEIKWKRV